MHDCQARALLNAPRLPLPVSVVGSITQFVPHTAPLLSAMLSSQLSSYSPTFQKQQYIVTNTLCCFVSEDAAKFNFTLIMLTCT